MGRISGKPNKLTAKVKERLATIIDEAMDSIDIKTMTKAERLKLIQIGVAVCNSKIKQVEKYEEEEPRKFEIEIIDSLSRYSDDELDKAIKE
jgi:hypothetical protein